MAAQAGLCLAWSETPEDTFCRVVAHVYVYACSSACVLSVCVCMWATDGLTEDGRMGGFKCEHVCVRVIVCACVRPRLRACDPVCEDRCIDARSDG